MATMKLPVVVPEDMGHTIVLGHKEPGKYDVNLAALGLAISAFELRDKTLAIKLGDNAEQTVDLSPMLPAVVADVFLKNVERQGDKIVFTVGERDSVGSDTTLEINVADLLPVQADGASISGNGTTDSKLAVRISAQPDNALYLADDGLMVTSMPRPNVLLTNASGTVNLGWIFAYDQYPDTTNMPTRGPDPVPTPTDPELQIG